eukprot:Opistho-2@2295
MHTSSRMGVDGAGGAETPAPRHRGDAGKMLATKDDSGRIHVYTRIRPLNERELATTLPRAYALSDDQRMVVMESGTPREKTFRYDGVFGEASSDREVYDVVGRPIVKEILRGFNGTVMACGQTGAGKTHTISGPKGIIPRVIRQIFGRVSRDHSSEYRVTLSFLQIYQERIQDLLSDASGPLEIREHPQTGVFVDNLSEFVVRSPKEVKALLKAGRARLVFAETKMNVASSRSHAVFQLCVERRIAGQKQHGHGKGVPPHFKGQEDRDDALASSRHSLESSFSASVNGAENSGGGALATAGRAQPGQDPQRRRRPRSATVSRQRSVGAVGDSDGEYSDAYATGGDSDDGYDGEALSEAEDDDGEEEGLDYAAIGLPQGQDVVLRGKITLCDLAGSERVSKSQATGVQLHEAKHINRSLLELGNVIQALAGPSDAYVPFRNSKLTRLLQESLGGNCKTSLVVCVSPCMSEIGESVGTLRFGMRAMRIRQNAHVNIDVDYKSLAEELANKLRTNDMVWKAKERDYQRRIAELERALDEVGEKNRHDTGHEMGAHGHAHGSIASVDSGDDAPLRVPMRKPVFVVSKQLEKTAAAHVGGPAVRGGELVRATDARPALPLAAEPWTADRGVLYTELVTLRLLETLHESFRHSEDWPRMQTGALWDGLHDDISESAVAVMHALARDVDAPKFGALLDDPKALSEKSAHPFARVQKALRRAKARSESVLSRSLRNIAGEASKGKQGGQAMMDSVKIAIATLEATRASLAGEGDVSRDRETLRHLLVDKALYSCALLLDKAELGAQITRLKAKLKEARKGIIMPTGRVGTKDSSIGPDADDSMGELDPSYRDTSTELSNSDAEHGGHNSSPRRKKGPKREKAKASKPKRERFGLKDTGTGEGVVGGDSSIAVSQSSMSESEIEATTEATDATDDGRPGGRKREKVRHSGTVLRVLRNASAEAMKGTTTSTASQHTGDVSGTDSAVGSKENACVVTTVGGKERVREESSEQSRTRRSNERKTKRPSPGERRNDGVSSALPGAMEEPAPSSFAVAIATNSQGGIEKASVLMQTNRQPKTDAEAAAAETSECGPRYKGTAGNAVRDAYVMAKFSVPVDARTQTTRDRGCQTDGTTAAAQPSSTRLQPLASQQHKENRPLDRTPDEKLRGTPLATRPPTGSAGTPARSRDDSGRPPRPPSSVSDSAKKGSHRRSQSLAAAPLCELSQHQQPNASPKPTYATTTPVNARTATPSTAISSSPAHASPAATPSKSNFSRTVEQSMTAVHDRPEVKERHKLLRALDDSQADTSNSSRACVVM